MTRTSLRIVAGVLGLRRFTIRELVRVAGVEGSAASAWLNRASSDWFEKRSTKPLGRGRPQTLWVLTDEGRSKLQAEMSDLRSVGEAIAVDATELVRCEALDRAERYLMHARSARIPVDREAALSWVGLWLASAGRRITAWEEAGSVVDRTLRDRLSLAREQASMLAGPPRIPASVRLGDGMGFDAKGFARQVLDVARGCLLGTGHVLTVPHVLWLERSDAARYGVQEMGLMAAVGLMEGYDASVELQRGLMRQVASIAPARCVAGMSLLADHGPDGGVGERVLRAVLLGLSSNDGLLGDAGIAALVGSLPSTASWGRGIGGAYLRVRMQMAEVRLFEVVEQVRSLAVRDDDAFPARAVAPSSDAFEEAEVVVCARAEDHLRRAIGWRGWGVALEAPAPAAKAPHAERRYVALVGGIGCD